MKLSNLFLSIAALFFAILVFVGATAPTELEYSLQFWILDATVGISALLFTIAGGKTATSGRDIEIMRKSTMMFGFGVIFMATTLSIFLFSTKSYWGISGLISFGAMSLVMFFEGFFERSHEKARIKGLQVNQ